MIKGFSSTTEKYLSKLYYYSNTMTKRLNITISDKVYAEIESKRGENRSEYVEELIRIGLDRLALAKTKKKRADKY